jgi:hypothetical protein
MAILIDPDEDPIERSLALCSEVSFELKQDVFTIEFPDSYDQHEDVPFKTTVISQMNFPKIFPAYLLFERFTRSSTSGN